jgi:hypothetical protein
LVGTGLVTNSADCVADTAGALRVRRSGGGAIAVDRITHDRPDALRFLTTFETTVIPDGRLQPDATYRVRVRAHVERGAMPPINARHLAETTLRSVR